MTNIRLGNLLWKDNTEPNSVSNPVNTKDVNSDSIKAELTAVKNELELVKAELQEIKANQLSGDQKVQLSGTIFGADISDRPPANSVPVGTTFVITNAELDAWISNGTEWVVI